MIFVVVSVAMRPDEIARARKLADRIEAELAEEGIEAVVDVSTFSTPDAPTPAP